MHRFGLKAVRRNTFLTLVGSSVCFAQVQQAFEGIYDIEILYRHYSVDQSKFGLT